MLTDRWRAPLVRAVKYGGVDAVLFPLNIGVATWLDWLGVYSTLATAAGFFAQITIAFFLNRRFTFHASVRTSEGLLKTWLISISDLILAVLATQLIQSETNLAYFWARLWAGPLVFAWDYVANSMFTFKTAFWK